MITLQERVAATLIMLTLCLAAYAQDVRRYSYRRTVTIEGLTRTSTFTFNDRGERVETDIRQSGDAHIDKKFWKRLPMFPIFRAGERQSAVGGFTVFWTDEHGVTGIPWTQESQDLMFPVEASDGRVRIAFFDYRLFRTSVSVKEMATPKPMP